MKLKGKKALITGAASGIGAEIAMLFAKEGANIVINYHTKEQEALDMKQKAESLYAVKAMAIQADVSEVEEVKSLVEQTIESFGAIDILVCSSGINHQASIVDLSVDDWDRMIKINLRSIFLCNKFVLPHMLKRKYGRIINITSQLGQIGGVNCSHYCASKAAIIGFTKSIAREVSSMGITANCIAPGPIETRFFFNGTTAQWRDDKLNSLPLGRFGKVNEVAPSALLLASDPDGNIYTGQTLGPNSGDVML